MSKVTDALVELANLARLRDSCYVSRADALKSRHIETAEDLLPPEGRQTLLSTLESDFRDIKGSAAGCLLQSHSFGPNDRAHFRLWRDLVGAIAQCLSQRQGIASSWLDARTVLTVEPGETNVSVDWAHSESQTTSGSKASRLIGS